MKLESPGGGVIITRLPGGFDDSRTQDVGCGGRAIHLHHIGRRAEGPLVEVRKRLNHYDPHTGGPLHIPGPGTFQHDSRFTQEYWAQRLIDAVNSGLVSKDVFRDAVEQARRNGRLSDIFKKMPKLP